MESSPTKKSQFMAIQQKLQNFHPLRSLAHLHLMSPKGRLCLVQFVVRDCRCFHTCWHVENCDPNLKTGSLEEEIDIEFFQNHQFSDFSCWFLGECIRTVPLWFLVVVFLFGLHQGYFKPSPASRSYMILWMIQPLLLCLSEAVKLHNRKKNKRSHIRCFSLMRAAPVSAGSSTGHHSP